jgi:hypothetical protein
MPEATQSRAVVAKEARDAADAMVHARSSLVARTLAVPTAHRANHGDTPLHTRECGIQGRPPLQ